MHYWTYFGKGTYGGTLKIPCRGMGVDIAFVGHCSVDCVFQGRNDALGVGSKKATLK